MENVRVFGEIRYSGDVEAIIWLFVAFAAGWFFAQFFKLINGIIKKKGKIGFSDIMYYMFKSGGMPSGHTASFVALDTAIGLFYGFNNPVFALAVCTTLIFIYDAVNVRYAVGEHGKLLNEIAISDRNPKTKPQKIIEGHTIPQVIMGGFLGVILGVVVFLMSGGTF